MMTMEAMSAAIEHELRQPLAAIVANAGAARRWLAHSPPNATEAGEAVEQITAEGTRAAEILGSVRRLFAAHDMPAPQPLDANAIIEDTVAHARVGLDSSAIGVHLRLDPNLPRVPANEQQLRELILNLVNNAADAMREAPGRGAMLSIATTALDAKHVEIAVSDTGSGIDERDMERIFEAFYTTKPDGMGMGLAICRTIVERHGGTMSVAQREPFGSVFRVVLPSAA
jgi:signal transduction histidine kinase